MNIANYPEHLAYAKNKGAGLRKEALKHLDGFLSTVKTWNIVEQRAFIKISEIQVNYD